MIQITVAGIDRTADIDLQSVQSTNALTLKSDTMDFDLYTDDYASRPSAGNEVIWLIGAAKEFGGIIVHVEEDMIAPGRLVYHCSCKDYSQVFDHHLVQEEYPAGPADEWVKAVVENYANRSGITFTTNNVQPCFDVAAQPFNFVPPSEAIKTYADLVEWNWYIDYDKDVHFAALETFQSPLPGNVLLADSDVASYHDLSLAEDIAQAKNRIFLRGFQTRSTSRQVFRAVGDGSSTWFPVGYPPWSVDAEDINVYVNGVPQPVLTDTKDGTPGDGKTNAGAYVCFDNLGIRFNQPPAAGTVITGDFAYALNAVTAVDDPESQAIMAEREKSDGVYEYAVEDPGLTAASMDTANARAQMLLYKYAYPKLTGSFGSYLGGWRAGQCFQLASAYRMGGVNQRMYVVKVVKRIVRAGDDEDVLHSDISISDSPYVV